MQVYRQHSALFGRNSECPSKTRFTRIESLPQTILTGGQSRFRRMNQKWNESFMDLLLNGSWCPRIELSISLLLLSDKWRVRFEFELASETRSSFHQKQMLSASSAHALRREWSSSIETIKRTYTHYHLSFHHTEYTAQSVPGKWVGSLNALSFQLLFLSRLIVAAIGSSLGNHKLVKFLQCLSSIFCVSWKCSHSSQVHIIVQN